MLQKNIERTVKEGQAEAHGHGDEMARMASEVRSKEEEMLKLRATVEEKDKYISWYGDSLR